MSQSEDNIQITATTNTFASTSTRQSSIRSQRNKQHFPAPLPTIVYEESKEPPITDLSETFKIPP